MKGWHANYVVWRMVMGIAVLSMTTCGAVRPGIVRADEEADETTDAVATLRNMYLGDAEQYGFTRDDEGRSPLAFRASPIMHWASDNDWSGDVFVWSHDGRPEAVGCMLSGPAGSGGRLVFHEFVTIGGTGLTMADAATAKKWSPTEGVAARPLADAPTPAASERARLLQLRALARSFTANMTVEDREWTLRLLPQPLHRYSSRKAGVVDGAIFAFVWGTGTDPEMLLAIEARKGEDGKTAWTYLPIQFTNRRVTFLSRGGEELWKTAIHVEPAGDSHGPYSTFYARTTEPDGAASEGAE